MSHFEDNNPFDDSDRPAFLNISSPTMTAESADEPTQLAAPGQHSKDHVSTFSNMRRASSSFQGRCQRIDQILPFLEAGGTIHIIDAGKNMEGAGGAFITYTIRTGDLEVRRRYSEFESLRASLARLYPCMIVPPIPEKQSVTEYVSGTARARENVPTIEHRKRMLETFLQRSARHSHLRKERVLHKFLDPNVSWSEVLTSPPISLLPKNILRAPPNDPASAHDDPAYANLPIPAHTSKASKTATDPVSVRLLAVEKNSKEFEGLLASTLEKTNRRTLKRFNDLSVEYNELGGDFNAFSLSEPPQLASSIEKLGQACDETYLSTSNLVFTLSNAFTEPLGEQTQMLAIVRQVLKYRRQKMTQVEQAGELLAAKRAQLEQLERSEQEAKRIDGALNRLGEPAAGEFPPTHDPAPVAAQSETLARKPASTPLSVGSFKFGLGKLNHAIHSLTDTDPALTRRQKIGATRELIAALEVAEQNSVRDLKYVDETISQEVETWEDSRREDWRRLMESVGVAYVAWARKALESWTEALQTIEDVPAHEYF
ncbi:hypothetical protein BCR37DRAFT_393367 [Protomyces lactucae-debilis]|uniref:PX domain-containing protein n=1 Tax=Protomyces lactucae-debilis TaxID=2754530 RepID=A0A1Y2FC57_PROLT|nr:uncharacterized protein BCR37DRAFT_393367 [Protomyces lactucae-debilis]ORY81510.1 hypothetical protein BCR37DRAFT_393367 [Protomyces lactucae-debilis]